MASQDGLKIATSLFEAAAWNYAIKVSCRCGHFATFDARGLWWHFQRKGFDDDLIRARARMWCRACRKALGQKVRPRALELVVSGPWSNLKGGGGAPAGRGGGTMGTPRTFWI